MIVVTNTIKVKKGHGESIAQRLHQSKGIDRSPGFVRMEVLMTEHIEGHDELKVSTTWEKKEHFDAWVNSESFRQTQTHKRMLKQSGSTDDGVPRSSENIMLGSQLSTHRVLLSRHS
ncbi:antibiotic biosynthesis monooxygenase [Paenibacillus harenae]|uniref:Heme oxygenase (Staphylobilin-producing) n=1 Tax=Paenibacillus harenae TaxID=306543 RepID=A0ABT9U9X5_PAEHA|nr:antibiotic biosynthesis monooxygenase [Paenibacillus harenae]MDQ0116388.1 heme oxygenase (staphylobilin-producing) [Paenibacillus harenae]